MVSLPFTDTSHIPFRRVNNNGVDGPPLVGEASIGLATLCFGAENVDGNHGHDPDDVLYIAFASNNAVPGANGPAWSATDAQTFQDSLSALGDQLVSNISA
jgi:hypothetical protein